MIKEFTIGKSHTINLGNYESMRIEASVTVTVNDGDDWPALKDAAQRELRVLLEETYRQHREKVEHQGATR
jgi:hypothetical protein